MACIHFFSRWNYVHKNVLFLLIRACASSYCLPNCCPLLLDSWRHTWTIRQAYSQGHCLMLKMWTQMIEERLNGESTAVILCKSTIIVFLSDDSSVEVWQDSSSSLCEGCAWLQEYDCTSLLHHCKNKWVILTRVVTLVTDNLRDSAVYESYSELHKSTQYRQLPLPVTTTIHSPSVKESLQMQADHFLTDLSASVLWL